VTDETFTRLDVTRAGARRAAGVIVSRNRGKTPRKANAITPRKTDALAEPPAPLSPWTEVKQFSAQVWKALGEDDVMFLASGVAFNLLLAVIPFVLLLASVSILFVGNSPDSAAQTALEFLDRLLPTKDWSEVESVRETVREVARVSGSVTLYSAIGFLWFSTRVFSSMRSVFQKTFDVPNERGILHGKLFDIACSFMVAIGITVYGSLSAYIFAATTRGAAMLTQLGVRESVMGPVEYVFGRLLAFLLVVLLCFAVYRLIPNRPIPSRTAWVGSITTSLLFELARIGFGRYVSTFSPSSLYTGAIATLVVVTLWTYYASVIFIIGAEVAQVVELRRVSRLLTRR
jgi:membrane protein